MHQFLSLFRTTIGISINRPNRVVSDLTWSPSRAMQLACWMPEVVLLEVERHIMQYNVYVLTHLSILLVLVLYKQ